MVLKSKYCSRDVFIAKMWGSAWVCNLRFVIPKIERDLKARSELRVLNNSIRFNLIGLQSLYAILPKIVFANLADKSDWNSQLRQSTTENS